METYYPSHRQDLLVGSLVSTLLVSTVFWLGNGSRYVHVSATSVPICHLSVVIPALDADPVVEAEDMGHARMAPAVDPVLPQLQDIPKPPSPYVIAQTIEAPHPETNLRDMTVIHNVGPGGGNGNKVWEFVSLDRAPQARTQVPPHYPSSMIQTGMTGEVLVDFIVDANGDVRNATAVRSTNREFESPAVAAVSRWKFHPGIKSGDPVFTHMQVPIEFSLNKD